MAVYGQKRAPAQLIKGSEMKRLGEVVVWVVLVVAALPFVVSAVLMPTAHSIIVALIVVAVGAMVVMVMRGISAARSKKAGER